MADSQTPPTYPIPPAPASIISNVSANGPKKKIAVLTSGGDAPGMNGVVRAVVRTAIHWSCEAYAVHEGYEGLVAGGHNIRRMHWEDVRGWLSRGGTLVGSARSETFRTREGRLKACANLVRRGIDALVVCGGDGSLTGADLFRREWPSLLDELVEKNEMTAEQVEPHRFLNIVGTVGSIDNDMSGTDSTIGCYSSLHRICSAVDDVFDTAASHQRGFIVEVMGRHCGWLALMAAISTGADWLFIPECPPRDGWEEDMCNIISRNRERGKRRTIVIVAEGAQDSQLNKISSEQVKDILSARLSLDTRTTILGHTQRGGPACVFDRFLSTLQGVEAVRAILEATPETPPYIITIRENQIERTPLVEAVEMTRRVAEAIGQKDFQTAMNLRDADFKDTHRTYINITTPEHRKMLLPPEKVRYPHLRALQLPFGFTDSRGVEQRMRIAIIHVGAPAGGMNPATRAAVNWCYVRGHTPIAIHNGFPGLVRHHNDTISSVRVVPWLESDSWVNLGGSEIGTNRGTPNEDLAGVAECFAKHKFDALFIIGGFEAFTSLSQLRKARSQYPCFRIPMILLPATISNNVPGTEYSLGSDTCLNALISFCDVIRQSASSSRRRVFVIETQGGRSGYVATLGGLSVGAYAVYIPEEGIDLDMLGRDVKYLRHNFKLDRGANHAGKLILRNECASNTYTTDRIAEIIKAEGGGHFETRAAVPGHFQQGGKPSPIDRVRSVRMAIKCIQHLEAFMSGTKEDILEDQLSAAVIGIKGSEVVISPMGGETGLECTDTDWKDRRPKNEFWRRYTGIIDMLSGRPMTGSEDSFNPLEGWEDEECLQAIGTNALEQFANGTLSIPEVKVPAAY
ncbi:6-phosphofructokinase, alpha subunit [Ascosphaera aggregata]|nr:6-phosphofructokinase, alpha subunit [Ascosphaera aggregata]